MALLSVIRRWHFREHLSIREIGRRTGLSRNTVRKYLRLGSVEPKFKVPERLKLDPFADRLAAWLSTEAKKNRKQKRTMKQLHADLMSLGYDGSYGRVAVLADPPYRRGRSRQRSPSRFGCSSQCSWDFLHFARIGSVRVPSDPCIIACRLARRVHPSNLTRSLKIS